MAKVEKYIRYKKMKDALPGNDIMREHLWMRRKYEDLRFKCMMLKPTERDWKQHTFDMLKKNH